MSAAVDKSEEDDFRERYAGEVRKMSNLQLDDELKKVKHQGMRTPGRRGEEIKRDEIDKEVIRRHHSK
jgi:hypothetical protein